MKRMAVVAFLGACAFTGGWLAQYPFVSSSHAEPNGPRATEATALNDRFDWVTRRALPGVVAVEATKPAKPGSDKKAVEESGSGVLVRLDGQKDIFAVTNNHVVGEATPQQITVTLADGKILKPGKVWTDPESDIAILRLDNAGNVPTIPLGDSDKMRVGHVVLAIGSPFGLNQSVTQGIISARERGQVSLGNTIRIKDFLQTDAAINPGSSGGPLLNLDGEVIGINTAIASPSGSNSGIAFSIPSNMVKRIAVQLIEKGAVSRGYLGLQLAATFEPNQALKLGLDKSSGALVETVYTDTPAAKAGLKASDVVLKIDGVEIRHENHFINTISGMSPGTKIKLDVWRDQRTISLEAEIGDWSRGPGGRSNP